MKIVRLKSVLSTNRKYRLYAGRKFVVFNGVDNFGDYCIFEDHGQPFMFLASSDCEVLRNNI